jgi:hypothetical protein
MTPRGGSYIYIEVNVVDPFDPWDPTGPPLGSPGLLFT